MPGLSRVSRTPSRSELLSTSSPGKVLIPSFSKISVLEGLPSSIKTQGSSQTLVGDSKQQILPQRLEELCNKQRAINKALSEKEQIMRQTLDKFKDLNFRLIEKQRQRQKVSEDITPKAEYCRSLLELHPTLAETPLEKLPEPFKQHFVELSGMVDAWHADEVILQSEYETAGNFRKEYREHESSLSKLQPRATKNWHKIKSLLEKAQQDIKNKFDQKHQEEISGAKRVLFQQKVKVDEELNKEKKLRNPNQEKIKNIKRYRDALRIEYWKISYPLDAKPVLDNFNELREIENGNSQSYRVE